MKVNKICLHHEVPPPDRLQAIAYYATRKPTVAKVLAPDVGFIQDILAVSPNTMMLGRHQPPVDVAGDPLGAAGRKFAMIRSRPDFAFIDTWEGENEVETYNEMTMAALAIFDQRMAYLMHQEGKRYAAMSWSEGHPPPYWEDTAKYPWRRFMEIMGPVFLSADIFIIHEYWFPRLTVNMWQWHVGRWPFWYDRIPFEMRKGVIIGECGADGGVDKQNPGHGYDGVVKPADYMADIIRFNKFLVTRPEVIGANVFQWGTWNKRKWWTFDLEHGMIPLMMAYEGEEVEDEPMTTPIRIRLGGPGSEVSIIELEEYLRGVVPAEVYPSWHEAALKAQAVAARTYALRAIQRPRHDVADLCNGPHCQAYIPSRINVRTDKAISDTRGIYLKHLDGNIYIAQYISNCGLERCPYCQGDNGYDGKTWTGRMCQWGSKVLADMGLDFRAILTRYYDSMVFSDGGGDGQPVIEARLASLERRADATADVVAHLMQLAARQQEIWAKFLAGE